MIKKYKSTNQQININKNYIKYIVYFIYEVLDGKFYYMENNR